MTLSLFSNLQYKIKLNLNIDLESCILHIQENQHWNLKVYPCRLLKLWNVVNN